MKTILVLSNHPDFAEAIRTGLDAMRYRVVHRLTVDEAEPLLVHGLAAACLLDADRLDMEILWMVDRLRRLDSRSPILVYAAASDSAWEEEAFLHGVTQVLTPPVRGRLLNIILDRLESTPISSAVSAPLPPVPLSRPPEVATPSPVNAGQTLGVLRDFSSILTYSLNAEALVSQFLSFLREMLGVNRAAIFLNRPCAPAGQVAPSADGQRLYAAAAIGLSPGLLEHIELSLDSGIGGQIVRLGRIVRRDSDEARSDAKVQKEFGMLGAQVAVPIADRHGLVGLAFFDGRITGESLVNAELELVFHLLEQVGLALRNIWLHQQIAENSEMMTDVLRELGSACLVVGHDLKVLHANQSARRHFGLNREAAGMLEFSDLPSALGTKIYQVLKSGAALGPFRYEPESSPGTVYSVNIVPFQRGHATAPFSALLTAEDLTQSEHLQQLEVEAEHLRLLKSMSNRLVNEIGNAIVPLSTHHQLLNERINDPGFRQSLDQALGESIQRILRLNNQMRFLAREGHLEQQTFPVGQLIEDAYQEARKHQPAETPTLRCEKTVPALTLSGDRAALKHALSEILLNALQANPKAPTVDVHLHAGPAPDGGQDLQIEVQDNGSGFTDETARKGSAAFFTTRVVGLGLGLTVSRKIIETHRGRLEIIPPQTGQPGVVRVSLPLPTSCPRQPELVRPSPPDGL